MANTFKFGNGNWAVKEDLALAYNDQNGNFKPLPFDFTRGSSATRVNKQGLIENVPSDQPRIDFFNNTNGHLLLEPSRTNYLRYSEDLSQSNWVKTNTGTGVAPTVTANYAISPDGSQNASRVQFDINGGTTISDRSRLYQDAGTGTSGSQAYSVYVKSNDTSTHTIVFRALGGSLFEKTVTTEWQRISIDATDNSFYFELGLYGDSATADTADILIWGAQMEEGSYATSLIPTSGSAVTRSADKCFQGGLTDKGILNNSALTLYFETDIQSDTSTTYQEIIALYNDANSVNLRLETRTNNQLYVQHSGVVSSGSNFNNLSLGSNSINFKKFAIYLTTTQFKIFADGNQISSTYNGSYNLDFDRIGFRIYNNPVETLIKNKEIKLYNTALSDSELQALTS